MEDCELYGDPCHLLIEVQRLQARIKKLQEESAIEITMKRIKIRILEKECQDRKEIEDSLIEETHRQDIEIESLESQLKEWRDWARDEMEVISDITNIPKIRSGNYTDMGIAFCALVDKLRLKYEQTRKEW